MKNTTYDTFVLSVVHIYYPISRGFRKENNDCFKLLYNFLLIQIENSSHDISCEVDFHLYLSKNTKKNPGILIELTVYGIIGPKTWSERFKSI